MAEEGHDSMSNGEIILYTTEDGKQTIQLRAVDGTVWLTQREIADLFDRDVTTINQHIKKIYEEEECEPGATIGKFPIVQTEGGRQVAREVEVYNLDVILAVGFRVRGPRGTQFRRWSNSVLSEYLVKGFAMDDARLKDPDADYFEELLARIRDIRSSEKQFYKKILEIYATSIDYDPSAEASTRFFQTVQNKMHWAAHGHTAAEIVVSRADADRDHMGLTSWTNQPKGGPPRKADAVIAKNYLSDEELHALNRIVSAYLEFAEFQAMNRRQMTMQAWVAKLDDFLRLGDRDVLTHAGKCTASAAKQKGGEEFERWRKRAIEAPSAVELHFMEAVGKVKQLAKTTRKKS
ncbi:virulence RhuM family protein [Acetobacter sp.]|uniref:virulence RhuM family protein n=1 Tax=Acetobacter sp. TaxID=440 RepID=UPI0025BDBA00|nr:virulence RhuM family protein [Acetobacter sp.]MCH4092471.1 virulence RhuM family protein [Acetobacter sp.]MCI1299605.1 virulence RhuM family protein [Acetobacter sp.]MCI1315515.1 virulence RhuM family protein [Acetobacter sp.]